MIQVGIGGSDLGPRSIYEALRPFGRKGRRVFFISNVDPDDAAAVLKQVDLATTLVNIVSKSGTTLETLTNETLVRKALQDAGLDPCRHCIAVTGEGSPMDNPDRVSALILYVRLYRGKIQRHLDGGLVMLGFYLGFEEIMEFLRGAAEIDLLAEEPDIRKNMPLLLALLGIWNHNFLGCPTLRSCPTARRCTVSRRICSNAIWKATASRLTARGNRSVVKLGRLSGENRAPMANMPSTSCCTRVRKSYRSNSLASSGASGRKTSRSPAAHRSRNCSPISSPSLSPWQAGQSSDNPNRIFPGNRPSVLLLADRLTPGAMGALLALYEAKIVLQGFAWNINSFDQEGVQLGKVLATEYLDCMTGKAANGRTALP